jgi:hypothetical protein
MGDKIGDVVAWRAFEPVNGTHVVMSMYLHKIVAQHEQNEEARSVLRKVAVPAASLATASGQGPSRMDADCGFNTPALAAQSATPPAPQDSAPPDPETPTSSEQKPKRKSAAASRCGSADSAVLTPPVKPKRDCDCYHCQHPSWKRRCLGPGGTQADAIQDYETRNESFVLGKGYRARALFVRPHLW